MFFKFESSGKLTWENGPKQYIIVKCSLKTEETSSNAQRILIISMPNGIINSFEKQDGSIGY